MPGGPRRSSRRLGSVARHSAHAGTTRTVKHSPDHDPISWPAQWASEVANRNSVFNKAQRGAPGHCWPPACWGPSAAGRRARNLGDPPALGRRARIGHRWVTFSEPGGVDSNPPATSVFQPQHAGRADQAQAWSTWRRLLALARRAAIRSRRTRSERPDGLSGCCMAGPVLARQTARHIRYRRDVREHWPATVG